MQRLFLNLREQRARVYAVKCAKRILAVGLHLRYGDIMKYKFTGRIRFSEVDNNSVLTFPALMDYFQDTSIFHGEDNGLSIAVLYENRIAWVLSGWQVRLYKPMKLNDIANVSTWAYSFRGSIGLRNYALHDDDGTLCALADTQYVLINIDTQRPARISQMLVDGYTVEPSHMETGLSRKIRIIPEETHLEDFIVERYMLDTNNHVNNAQYIKKAMSFLPQDMRFNTFRASYLKQAHLGDFMCPYCSELEKGVQIKFYDADHEPYFVAEWTEDSEQADARGECAQK